MYRVIVHVNRDERVETFEFLEDGEEAARRRAEEVAQAGFWTGVLDADQFIAPSSIHSVEVVGTDDGRRDVGEGGDS